MVPLLNWASVCALIGLLCGLAALFKYHNDLPGRAPVVLCTAFWTAAAVLLRASAGNWQVADAFFFVGLGLLLVLIFLKRGTVDVVFWAGYCFACFAAFAVLYHAPLWAKLTGIGLAFVVCLAARLPAAVYRDSSPEAHRLRSGSPASSNSLA